MNMVSLAMRNVRRDSFRSSSLFLVVAVLSCTLLSIGLLHAGLTHSIEKSRKMLGADIMVVPSVHAGNAEDVFLMGTAGSFTMKDSSVFRQSVLDTYAGVEAVSGQLFVTSAPLACCSVSDTTIVGYEPETDFVVHPWIREGRPPAGSDAVNEAVAGADIGAGINGRLKLYGREFLVTAKLERTGMRHFDSGIFIPMKGVRTMIAESGEKALRRLAIGNDEISCLLIRLESGTNPEIPALLIDHDYPGLKALVPSSMVRKTANSLAVPLRGITLLLALQWLSSLLLIGVVHAFSAELRRAEFGILTALGATDAKLRAMVAAEILAVSAAACAAGITAGFLLVRVFARHAALVMKIPFVLPEGTSLAALAAGVFVVSLGSAAVPAFLSVLRVARTGPFALIQGERKRSPDF
ncbi:MAG: FtsX-like permease family protein [Thermodesulfovibrionales bacterium]